VHDLAIIGSGFGGALTAMVARRLGLSVLLLERGTHPRFAIGESTSPLTNLLLEQIAVRNDLPRLVPLTEYGKWQRTYPEIGCGLKRGFSFYSHQAGHRFVPRSDRANELLVAASPCDEVADTHWLRADFDHFLVREAQALGVEYVDEVALTSARWRATGGVVLSGERGGGAFTAEARFVVDATGPRGFLARTLGLAERPFSSLPRTQALFTHFAGVRRWADLHPPEGEPPYPPDAAALHHVFDGGWIWVLRFGNGITSAGIAATDGLAGELGLADGAAAWERVLARFPSIREQFAAAEAIRPFVYSPRLSYRSAAWSGPGWMLLPSAGAFVDPLFSTGMPLTLLGIERLGRALEEAWGTTALDARVAEGAALSQREVEAAAALVGASYAGFGQFPLFAAFSMFYFSAASHSEMARRLGSGIPVSRCSGGRNQVALTPVRKPLTDRAYPDSRALTVNKPSALDARVSSPEKPAQPGLLNPRTPKPPIFPLFLRVDHPEFGAAFERLSEQLRNTRGEGTLPETMAFSEAVSAGVAPLNVAGLCDAGKRNWYPVDLRDLVLNAEKLGMSPTAMEAWIREQGWDRLVMGPP
jgi:tetracycline 7-halogenase / FADH2 O2-dependent halogenase